VGRIKGTITRTKKKEETGEGDKGKEGKKGLLKGEVDAGGILARILEHPNVPPKVRADIMLIAGDTIGGVPPHSLVSYPLGNRG
jgi:hypothetical protein